MSKSIQKIDEPVIAITINKTYREGISSGELYDSTRGIWTISKPRAENAKYVFAVYKGVVKEVYEPNEWHKECMTEYKFRQPEPTKRGNRFEFVGELADEDIRDKYIGKTMPDPQVRFPIRYYNC